MTEYDPVRPTSTHHDLSADLVSGSASSLDELRAALEQSEQVADVEFTPCDLFGPGNVIRLRCNTDINHIEWKNMQLASMPKAYRNKRMPDPRKINELEAFAALIGRYTLEIALRQPDGSYKAMEGTFDDPHLLAAFGAAEAAVAVRRIFVKDAYLVHAGRDLIEAAGLGERKPGEPGDEDPT